ncbi:DNA-directed RNA polymerase core subunit rpc40 [Conglomerata obtusa]
MYKLTQDQIIPPIIEDNLTFNELLNNIQIKIIKKTALTLEVDILNIDCSIANAIRRIMISEIPTLAIHNITINKYSGVLPEEIICHRIGLIPLLVDPIPFEFVTDELNEKNTLTFTLKIQNKSKHPLTVYSDDIKWKPVGRQIEWVKECKLKSGIPITKLGSGEFLDFEMNAVKNCGREHAKWSPVCPVSYRLHPHVEIGNFEGEEAIKLKECFSRGVIEIKGNKAFVNNDRNEMMSLKAFRFDEFKDRVFIGKKHNHFIFNIESVFIDPVILLKQSIVILKGKCRQLREEIEDIN